MRALTVVTSALLATYVSAQQGAVCFDDLDCLLSVRISKSPISMNMLTDFMEGRTKCEMREGTGWRNHRVSNLGL